MKLFRRLILSLFPNNLQNNGMNPVGVFIGLISPKQFFSVVHRRIVENYKLNLFDISLEPFEAKLGLGDKPNLQVKDSNLYYAYGSVSNLNGRSFYSPANLSSSITLAVSVLVKEKLRKHPYYFAESFFVSIFLMTFVFVARIRVFPQKEQKIQFQRFLDCFFSFYGLVLQKQKKIIDPDVFESIKNDLLKDIQIFFMLFRFYKRMNSLFTHKDMSIQEYYQRLFYEEMKGGKLQIIVNEFVKNAKTRIEEINFSKQDEEILKLVFPADVHIRYIFQSKDRYLITHKLISKIFKEIDLQAFSLSFLKGDALLEEFLTSIHDYTHIKNNYFAGIKAVTNQKFKLKQDYKVKQEIDSFMSTIEESGSMEGVKVPEQLKKEGNLIDKLVNFYITYVGGLRIGRGDTFYLRLFRKPLLESLIGILQTHQMRKDGLYFYGGLLYNYTKNVFYYKYAFENVRAGNQSFSFPSRGSSFKEVYSNMYMLKLFDEYYLNTVLQDISYKNIKLTVSNEKITNKFKQLVGKKISILTNLDTIELINKVYSPLFSLLDSSDQVSKTLMSYVKEQDGKNLKDNLYTLDLWVWRDFLVLIVKKEIDFSVIYNDMNIVSIAAIVRETLFGLLLYLTRLYILEAKEGSNYNIDEILKIYCVDVINIGSDFCPQVKSCIDEIFAYYKPILSIWVQLDDNKEYLDLAISNWNEYRDKKDNDQIVNFISGEDSVWFRGFLKTVTYYNKRYLMPK